VTVVRTGDGKPRRERTEVSRRAATYHQEYLHANGTMQTRILLPLAIAQGLWVKARTPELPPARGRRGRVGEPEVAARRVVGIGDSIIAGTGVQHQREALTGNFARLWHERCGLPVEWRAHGFNGATSTVILHKIVPHAPSADVYLISTGVNDSIHGLRAEHFADNLRGIVRVLREKSPQSTLLYAGLPHLERFPTLPWPLKAVLQHRTQRLQAVAREVAAKHPGMICFDFPPVMTHETFASDGFHPSAEACGEWAARLVDLWLGGGPP
jgi:lysophospholipase L1-like esterase